MTTTSQEPLFARRAVELAKINQAIRDTHGQQVTFASVTRRDSFIADALAQSGMTITGADKPEPGSLEDVANRFYEEACGLRARLRLAEKTMSVIEDEHAAAEGYGKYCDEGACHYCRMIERINLALAGEA